MAQKTPLGRVNDEFGGKDKLVDRLVTLLGSTTDEPKDELRKRLLGVANRKLLRLERVTKTVKESHGSRDNLVEATAARLGRSKDKDYVEKLSGYSSARLLDVVAAAARRLGGPATAPVEASGRAAKPGAKAGAKSAAKPVEAKPGASGRRSGRG